MLELGKLSRNFLSSAFDIVFLDLMINNGETNQYHKISIYWLFQKPIFKPCTPTNVKHKPFHIRLFSDEIREFRSTGNKTNSKVRLIVLANYETNSGIAEKTKVQYRQSKSN